jgi:hypothetical protein
MFDQIRKWRKESEIRRIAETVPDILARYGELLEKYPTAYMDEKWLPVNKASMKQALKIGWLMSKNDQQREYIRSGWVYLSLFQKDVGNIPADANVPVDATPESIASLDRFLHFAKLGRAEDEANMRELDEFIRSQDARR